MLQRISSLSREQQKIQIARHDFFNDGQAGYVIYTERMESEKATNGYIEIYENLGKNRRSLNIKKNYCAVRPTGKGVTEAGEQAKNLTIDNSFDREYALFLEFKAFIRRFSTDKSFQLDRVRFPIIWDEYSNGNTTKRRSTKANWKPDNVLKPSGDGYEVFVNYPTAKNPDNARVGETCKGGDCGYGAGLGFKRINGV